MEESNFQHGIFPKGQPWIVGLYFRFLLLCIFGFLCFKVNSLGECSLQRTIIFHCLRPQFGKNAQTNLSHGIKK